MIVSGQYHLEESKKVLNEDCSLGEFGQILSTWILGEKYFLCLRTSTERKSRVSFLCLPVLIHQHFCYSALSLCVYVNVSVSVSLLPFSPAGDPRP